MKREDMVRRLAAGEDPLELSIEKWRDIRDKKGIDDGLDNCALCETYYNVRNVVNHCRKCVIYRVVKRVGCHGTPYTQIQDNWAITPEEAEREIAFLESLREKHNKMRQTRRPQ